jgi:hypothetical protein
MFFGADGDSRPPSHCHTPVVNSSWLIGSRRLIASVGAVVGASTTCVDVGVGELHPASKTPRAINKVSARYNTGRFLFITSFSLINFYFSFENGEAVFETKN